MTVVFLGVEAFIFAGGVITEGSPALMLVCGVAASLAILSGIVLAGCALVGSAVAAKTTCALIVSSTVCVALVLMVFQLWTVGRFYTDEIPERDVVPAWLALLSANVSLVAGLAFVIAVALLVARTAQSLRRR